ncbi:MAG: FeoB-associated Cys-rich membrane protein [Clostridiales bacterium]|nr:FeoB-associated Cys-rich membrane protein [Clostridiales bacterium]
MIATIIIGCVLACLAGLAIVYIIRQKRKGNCVGCDVSTCGCKCSGCSSKEKPHQSIKKQP